MSNATLQQILEQARTLPPDDKRQLRDALEQDLQGTVSYRTSERERAWIEQHRDEYMNQWVALDGDKLLAHGTDPRAVADAARAAGISAPYMERIRQSVEPFWGGWV